MLKLVDKCVDHPNNVAVEACSTCGDYICGLHDRSLCLKHENPKDKPSTLPIKIFVMVFGIGITFFFMTVVSRLVETISLVGNSDEGDIVTVDDEVITVTENVALPDLSVMIIIFFVVSLFILSIIGFILYNWTKTTKDDDYSFIGNNEKTEDARTYYCQNCGQQLTMQDLECTKCGKSTDDERKLLQ